MTGRRLVHWVAGLSVAAYILWFLVLRYGTAREKELATAAIILSPIPPIP